MPGNRARGLIAALLTLFLLGGCAPRLVGVDPARPPSPGDWGPHPAPVEWWYLSAYLPEAGLAFHWAFFKAYPPEDWRVLGVSARALYPYPIHAVHLAITDLRTGRRRVVEAGDYPEGGARVAGAPLRLVLDGHRLFQQGAGFRLVAPGLDLTLVPLKPAVVHPPGYSGTAGVGRMYYVSFTRLALLGEVAGRRVRGFAWMDHQWGDQLAGVRAGWDWFGLRLSDWSEVMLYRVRTPSGRVVALHASLVEPSGRVRRLEDVGMTPLRYWTSPTSGYRYAVAWRVRARGLSLVLRPRAQAQELRTATTHVAYWEGPVAGPGERDGHAVWAEGMGEFIGGRWPPRGPRGRGAPAPP